MDTKPAPLIVYGALRSGTTLLRLMLRSHPKLNCLGENDYVFDALTKNDVGQLVFDQERLANERIYRVAQEKYLKDAGPFEAPADMIEAFRVNNEHADAVPVLMIHRHIDRVLEVMPDAKVIHILRDPRDVARSSIGMGWATDVYHGVGHWIGTENAWHASVEALKGASVHTVRYEDLIRDFEEELTAICEFAGLTFEERMRTYYEGTTYEAPDVKLIEQWRRKLTPYERGLVEGRVGPLLAQSGYAPSGDPIVDLKGWKRVQLKVQNRVGIFRGKVKKFGFVDTVILAAGERLNFPSWSKPALSRRDEKILGHVR